MPLPTARRFLFAVSLAVLSAAGRSLAAPARDATFDIPAGEAATALQRFSAQSGQQILYSDLDVEGVATNEVRGKMRIGDALDRLIARTPLVATWDSKDETVAVARAGGQSGGLPIAGKKKTFP